MLTCTICPAPPVTQITQSPSLYLSSLPDLRFSSPFFQYGLTTFQLVLIAFLLDLLHSGLFHALLSPTWHLSQRSIHSHSLRLGTALSSTSLDAHEPYRARARVTDKVAAERCWARARVRAKVAPEPHRAS
jgi:hypothetical protein